MVLQERAITIETISVNRESNSALMLGPHEYYLDSITNVIYKYYNYSICLKINVKK